MSQVIEVRLINPVNREVLCDEFTVASSHREAVELALGAWSGGVGILKDMEQDGEDAFVPAGANASWRYAYRCTLEDSEVDREVLAVLFAQYKESETNR